MSERYSPTERIGVNHVESIFLKKFKWIFREQPILDMGIDAQVEYVNGNGPTGKLIGLQIKTGLSHFHEKKESFTFYLNDTHYKYWINHSLPVIIVGHIPEYEMTIWEFIEKKMLKKPIKDGRLKYQKKTNLTEN
ncbi:DUF4365 domain-containing protein [Mesonia maritima]|uniref:DUF4365 domain-containing protein n=1 Tax=Mesonia maritima TaxID=1793873 RepID=A0ABU1KAJ0_9FLAO|nr:DUF4365 domain-containing protein [Mesonia maritima]MDR6302316.1 hypothetical protein [Mesonia maritima]